LDIGAKSPGYISAKALPDARRSIGIADKKRIIAETELLGASVSETRTDLYRGRSNAEVFILPDFVRLTSLLR
jgi:hypothetical protein